MTPPPEDFASTVSGVRDTLNAAADKALPKHDPFRALISGLDGIVEVFPAFVHQIEKVVEGGRTPLSPEQHKALCADASSAASTGAALGTRREIARLSQSINRKAMLCASAAAATIGLLCAGAGYMAGRDSVRSDVVQVRSAVSIEAGSAQTWLDLMRANPDPQDSVASAQTWTDQKTHRKAGLVPLFLETDKTIPTRS